MNCKYYLIMAVGLILGIILVGCGGVSEEEIELITLSYNFETYPDGTAITGDTADTEGRQWKALAGDEFLDWGFKIGTIPSDGNTVIWTNLTDSYTFAPNTNYLTISPATGGEYMIEISFLNPVRGVELSFIGASINYKMEVYDQTNTLLASPIKSAEFGASEPTIIRHVSDQSNISRIVFRYPVPPAALIAISELNMLVEQTP